MNINPKAQPVYKPTATRVTAPPVYRPLQMSVNPGVQLKPVTNFRTETRPAPPVYRPQQFHAGVQQKSADHFKRDGHPKSAACQVARPSPLTAMPKPVSGRWIQMAQPKGSPTLTASRASERGPAGPLPVSSGKTEGAKVEKPAAKHLAQTGVPTAHSSQMKKSEPAAPGCIQRAAAADLAAAQQNLVWLVAEMAQLNTSGTNVWTAINAAPGGARKNEAAAGIRYYWERFIDTFDGKKAEMYEAEALVGLGRLPILSSDDSTEPDVRFVHAGQTTAIEVKTINSNNTSNVNTLIKGADTQLAKRTADTRRIKIRIENRNNRWPSAVGAHWAVINNNTDLRNWLTQPGIVPSLGSADEIQIEGINVPYGGAGATRNFSAEVKGNGDVKKTGALVW